MKVHPGIDSGIDSGIGEERPNENSRPGQWGPVPGVTPMNSSVLRPWCWLSVLLLARIAVAQECVPGPRGMMGWWRGEGTPASLFDLNPPATTEVGYAAGRVGQGMLLGSAGAGVDLGSPPFLDVQNFTVQAWVRRSSTDAVASDGSATGWIVARGAGGFGFGIGQDGRLQFEAVGMAAPLFIGIGTVRSIQGRPWPGHHRRRRAGGVRR